MKRRGMIAIAGLTGAAAAAHAQMPTATVTLNWRNTQTGAQDPLLPGHSADIWVDVAFGPPVGTPVAMPQGIGTIAGLGNLYFDLVGQNNAVGRWQLSGTGFAGTPEPDGPGTNTNHMNYGRRNDVYGGWGVTPIPPGPPPPPPTGGVRAAQAGQFPLIPPANSFNPIVEIWRAGWLPNDFTARTAIFDSQQSTYSPYTGVALLVLLPGDIHHWLHVDPANIQWDSVHIPIPSPSTLALLGAGGLVLCRRPRRALPPRVASATNPMTQGGAS